MISTENDSNGDRRSTNNWVLVMNFGELLFSNIYLFEEINMIKQVNDPRFVLIGGPSGIGKTLYVNELIRIYPNIYSRPIAYTTRAKREQGDEEDYVYISVESIIQKYEKGELLNLDNNYGDYYGISRKSMKKIMVTKQIPIREVHPKNHKKIKNIVPTLISILLIPENAREWMYMYKNRKDRIDEDRLFFEKIDYGSFDIVKRTTHTDSLVNFVKDLNKRILNLIKGQAS